MITTADHEDRVVPGHSFKFAAALQAAQAGESPTLIRIQTKAGHGFGKPTAILIEEMANLGAPTFIRIGTSGGIADTLKKGDFVIATGAVRRDGTTKSYVWKEYPAAANHEVVLALIDAATRLNLRFDAGVSLSVDGFYSENKVLKGGKIAPMSGTGYMISSMVERLADAKRMGVKNM